MATRVVIGSPSAPRHCSRTVQQSSKKKALYRYIGNAFCEQLVNHDGISLFEMTAYCLMLAGPGSRHSQLYRRTSLRVITRSLVLLYLTSLGADPAS
jgi:hypothetical protein